MKKFFSLFAAVLFAGSMMAGTVTFTSSDFAGQGKSGGAESGSEISATKSGVTVSCTNGYGASESFRCYAGSTLSVTSSETIIKISFATTGGKDGGLPANVDVNSKSYSVTMTSQGRITQLVVSLDGDAGEEGGEEGGEGGEEGGEGGEELGEINSCASAAAALANAEHNVEINNGASYTISGYVTFIETAYSTQYENISFWMADTKDGGKVLQAYRCKPESANAVPAVGDKVEVTGKLKKYNSIPEFSQGCTCKILEKGEGGDISPVKTTFDSFEELIEADFSEKTTVTVSFENLKITGLYYSESGAKYCGIFLDVKAKNDKDIEIYFKNEALPETWKEGGKVSGTITGEWSHYVNESKNQDVWEIVPTETGWSWTNLTYTEDQTAVENTIADAKAVKIVRDGQIYIFRDGQLYNLTGAAVK